MATRVALPQLASNSETDAIAFLSQVRSMLTELERQLRAQVLVSSTNSNKVDKGLQRSDAIFQLVTIAANLQRLQVGVWDGKKPRFLNQADLFPATEYPNFVGWRTGTAAVTAAATELLFPNQRDWGFYERTGPTEFWLVYNDGTPTLRRIQFT